MSDGQREEMEHGPKHLWAPWRIEYIKSDDNPSGCIFCDKPAEQEDRTNLILFRGKTSFVIMNKYPYNNGHLMIVPYTHTSCLGDLSAEERLELIDLAESSREIIQSQMNPHGFNIGMNLGRAAGAGIDDHLHFHLVPRWNGDTNFMPVTGGTKVISESLQDTWDNLHSLFKNKL